MNKGPEATDCFGLLVHDLFTVSDTINFVHKLFTVPDTT